MSADILSETNRKGEIVKTNIKAVEAVNNAVQFINDNPGTSGARAMARVLLHAYNHVTQPLDITELCVLSQPYQEWGWEILKYRVHGHEPDELVADMRAFERVVDKYWES